MTRCAAILGLFLSATLWAQTENKDSVAITQQKQQLPLLKDSARVDGLNNLSLLFILTGQKDSAAHYADLALREAERLPYTHGLAMAYFRKARLVKHFNDDFPKSEALSLEALRWFDRTPNKKGIDTLYSHLASMAGAQSKFSEGIYYTDKFYQWALQEQNEAAIYEAIFMKSIIYRQAGDYEKGFEYARQSHQLALQAANEVWIYEQMFSLGNLYMKIEDYRTALDYFQQGFRMENAALAQHSVNKNWDIWIKMELAELYSHLGLFDSAWYCYRLFKPSKNHVYYRVYLVSTGECYYRQGDYHRALQSLLPGLQYHQQLHDRNEVMRTLLIIANTYMAVGNDSAALRYAREGLSLARQTRYRQNIRDGYKVLYAVYDARGRQDSAYYYFRLYVAMKDSVTSDQARGRFAAYRYEQQVALLSKEKEVQQARLQRTSLLKNISLAGIGVVALLGFFLLRNIALKRRNEAHRRTLAERELQLQKLEHEKTQAALQQQATNLKLQALRAQMNPHFIFNCLNSINHFILKNETEAASDYLTRFSRLTRMVLNNSQRDFITLAEDLECLELYIQLEQLRFKNSFQYAIHWADEIDCCELMVPPLLLQPFVENAIGHGLMHKEGKGHLAIELFQQDDWLCCKITDDGIGRKKVAELKSKWTSTHKSMGMQITASRIEMLQQEKQLDTAIKIIDVVLADGSAGGTEVVIKMPLMDEHMQQKHQ